MVTQRSHAEKTSNETKTVGFDYQYYFFLWRVLQLRTGQSVGLEVADDVHTELDDDFQILFQLKHTVQKKADQTPENLTKYDPDLWKTMWNWSKVITDNAVGRGGVSAQLEFVNKTDFVLVTNKSRAAESSVEDLFSEPNKAKAALESLLEKAEGRKTKKYMGEILSLTPEVLQEFFRKTTLDLEVDDLIARCETAIVEKQIAQNRAKELLRNVDSQIRQDSFLAVKEGRKLRITFAEFSKKYRALFDIERSSRLRLKSDYEPLPLSIDTQVFIRQLIDIGDFAADDLEEMASLTICKKTAEKNLLRWELDGEITGLEIQEFDEESMTHWNNVFRELHRRNVDSPESRAISVVDRLRGVELLIRDQNMGIRFSNGQFYKLADLAKIGFLPDWEDKYGAVAAT